MKAKAAKTKAVRKETGGRPEEMKALPDSKTSSKTTAISRGTCRRCGQEIRHSMAGWIHSKSGSALCQFPPEKSSTSSTNKGEKKMTTKNAAKKNAAKKNAAAKLALVPKKPVQKVAVKKVAPKAAMVKHTKAQVAAVERNRMDPQLTLIKATNTNPRREGSWGFQSFAVIKNGMTIEQAKAKGARAKDIAWDIAHGNLKLGRRA